MKNLTLYNLTPSQDVSYLQCKYTLFKRVVNILTSLTLDEQVDFDVMKKALNLLIERHDCLRIRFVKKNKNLMQYIVDCAPVEKVPYIKFNTKDEQDAFIAKTKKKAIKQIVQC